ncbi:MAG TPA: DUF4350 domain-containing protein [Pyrinomonadaceae bacterium]|nr:DUF4350 domain-containing protein [Pyrinomonadaceae bacterium]
MRQRFLIISGLIFLVILLVGLNAATFVRKEKTPDTELSPNRSTYNTGATGTRAFYDLLAETGRNPARWQKPVSALASDGKNKPSTFVIIGRVRREFDDREIEQLLNWVSMGGKLVIIDREPPAELIKTTANWNVSVEAAGEQSISSLDPSDQKQMTEKTVAAKPLQPTVFTAEITAVQGSRLSSSIKIERFFDETTINTTGKFTLPPPLKSANANQSGDIESDETNSAPPIDKHEDEIIETPALSAPVVHLAENEKNLLVDFPFGSGQIVFLSDSYIVSNGGINLVDNARLAVNIVGAPDGGIIAFDEYHQGFGATNNRFLEYFDGTPVIAFFLQFAVIAGLILLAQSRRFARPLPETEPNRLSKLEYVSAMAELQQRVKAFDLAVENIYTDFRRRVSKSFGVDNYTVSLRELAKLTAERTNEAESEIENLMFKCEEIVRGEPTNKKEVLHLTSRLRRIEEKLGLQRGKKK